MDAALKNLIQQIDSGVVALEVDSDVLPAELQHEPPRELPDWLRHHKRVRRPRRIGWFLVSVFVVAVVCGARPWAGGLSQVGFWSAAVLGLLGLFGVLGVGELKFVRLGSVATGLIARLELVPAQAYNGETIAWQHQVMVQLKSTNGDIVTWEFQGLPIGSADRDRVRTSLRVADPVSVLWMPGRFEKTARLYAFLNFNHDRFLVRDENAPSRFWSNVLAAVAIVAMFTALGGNLYFLSHCVPVGFSVPLVTTIGVVSGLVLGGGLMWGLIRYYRRQDELAAARNREAAVTGGVIESGSSHLLLANSVMGWGFRLMIAAGSVLICGLSVVMWLFGANLLLDRSVPADVEIAVLGVRETKGENRTFDVTFARVDQPGVEYSRSFAPRDMPGLLLQPGAKALVSWSPGALGWPWIADIRPTP